jgi:hypothetical protein
MYGWELGSVNARGLDKTMSAHRPGWLTVPLDTSRVPGIDAAKEMPGVRRWIDELISRPAVK